MTVLVHVSDRNGLLSLDDWKVWKSRRGLPPDPDASPPSFLKA